MMSSWERNNPRNRLVRLPTILVRIPILIIHRSLYNLIIN